MVPVSDNDMVLLRLMDGKEYLVGSTVDSPVKALPGMHFFDAWRLVPSQAQRIVASEKRSEESPLEQVVKEEEVSAWATASAPTRIADVPTDPQGYELSRSTTRALIDFDTPLRDMLVGIDKRSCSHSSCDISLG